MFYVYSEYLSRLIIQFVQSDKVFNFIHPFGIQHKNFSRLWQSLILTLTGCSLLDEQEFGLTTEIDDTNSSMILHNSDAICLRTNCNIYIYIYEYLVFQAIYKSVFILLFTNIVKRLKAIDVLK